MHTQHENQKQMLIDASPRCEENQMHLIRICRRTEVKTPKDSGFFNSTYTKKQILPTIFLISYVCIFLNMHSKVLVYSTIQILHVSYLWLWSILVKVLSSFEIILKKYMFQKENININIFILFLKILLLDLSRVTSFIR